MIENTLPNERIEELLNAGIEHDSLDYKETFDPREAHDIVELAKDIAAMANTKGGYLVIGVDKNFRRVGIKHELILDEAEIRSKIYKYFPGVDFYCKEYKDGESRRYFIIYVPPQEYVFPAIEGKYSDKKGREKIVFRPGQLLIRDGSRSKPADSREFKNFLDRLLFDKRIESLKRIERLAESFNLKSKPERIQEKLLSNLFLIKKIPTHLYLSSTNFTSKKEIFDVYENIPSEFTLKENKLITFYNLENKENPFRELIDYTSIEKIPVEKYLQEENKWRYVVELLNLNLKSYCKLLGLIFEKKYGRYFFPASFTGKKEIEWKPRGKKRAKRKVVWEYYFKGDKYYLHKGAKIKVTKIGNKFFLVIQPCFVITKDGVHLTESKELQLKYQSYYSRLYNFHLINDLLFWSALLKGKNKDIIIKRESYEIIISSSPIVCNFPVGFSEDKAFKNKRIDDLDRSEIITILSIEGEIYD